MNNDVTVQHRYNEVPRDQTIYFIVTGFVTKIRKTSLYRGLDKQRRQISIEAYLLGNPYLIYLHDKTYINLKQ